MLHVARVENSHAVVGPLTLPALIECLEERIGVMRQAGHAVEIGGFPDLLEQAVRYLHGIDARAVRMVAEARRDYGGQ